MLPVAVMGPVLGTDISGYPGKPGEAAANVPTRSIPDIAVRTGARFSAQMRAIAPDLGYARRTSNDKGRRGLGWQPRGAGEAITAAAQSPVAKGLVKKK